MDKFLKVLSVDKISDSVKVFSLSSDSPLLDFKPGSFIDIKTPYGWRSYSLLDEKCLNNTYRIAVKKDNNGKKGSLWMHQDVEINDFLNYREPKNNFHLKENLNKNVFIAGGIGVTPLISLLKGDLDNDVQQFFYFSYGNENDENIFSYLVKEKNKRIELILHSTKREGKHLDINEVVDTHGLDANYFCCGPEGMIQSFNQVMADRDVSNYFFEYFTAERKVLTSINYSDGLDHIIYLEKSQKTVMMSPNEYLLDALKREGIDIAYSCESGICGTCEARILKGQVEHNDHILTPSEKQKGEAVMLCTARPLSPELVLDL